MDAKEQALLMADLRTIGVVVEVCLGCRKIDCDSCPCGSGTAINCEALSPEAVEKLKQIYFERAKARMAG